MRKRFYISLRRRVLWTGVVLFCLLFQQLAMAAYVCTLPNAPANVAMTVHCAGMGMKSTAKVSTSHQHGVDLRCAEHCAVNTASTHDVRAPTVPPLLLASVLPTMQATIANPAARPALPDTALHRPDPPPTLRFCSLLI